MIMEYRSFEYFGERTGGRSTEMAQMYAGCVLGLPHKVL